MSLLPIPGYLPDGQRGGGSRHFKLQKGLDGPKYEEYWGGGVGKWLCMIDVRFLSTPLPGTPPATAERR